MHWRNGAEVPYYEETPKSQAALAPNPEDQQHEDFNCTFAEAWSRSHVEESKALCRELGAAGAPAAVGKAEGSSGEGVALSCLPQGVLLKALLPSFCRLRVCLKN